MCDQPVFFFIHVIVPAILQGFSRGKESHIRPVIFKFNGVRIAINRAIYFQPILTLPNSFCIKIEHSYIKTVENNKNKDSLCSSDIKHVLFKYIIFQNITVFENIVPFDRLTKKPYRNWNNIPCVGSPAPSSDYNLNQF